MKVTAQQFISNGKDKGTFATVFKYFSKEAEIKTAKEGDLYCLMLISGSNTLPAERISKFVWDGILDGYIYSPSNSTNDSLKDSIKEGVRKLKALMKNDKSLEELGVDINFVLVAQKKEGLYIGNLGENEVFVFKEGKFVNISDILGKSKASTAGIALAKEDILLISTKGLLSKDIVENPDLTDLQKVLDTIKSLGRKLTGTQALLLFASSLEPTKNTQLISKREDFHEEVVMPKPPKEKLFPKFEKIKIPKINVKLKVPKIENESIKKIFFVIKIGYLKTRNILLKLGQKIFKLVKIQVNRIDEKLKTRYERKHWYKRIASKVSEVRVNRKDFSPKGMRIDGYRTRDLRGKRVKQVLLILVIIVLIALGINFTIKGRKASEVHKQAAIILTDTETLVAKAENSSTTGANSAETAIYQAKNKLKELPDGLNDKDKQTENALESRILAVEDFLYKRVGLTDNDGKISTFLDSRLAFGEGSNPSDIEIYSDSSSNQYLLISDIGLNNIERVALYDKTVSKLTDTNNLIKSPTYLSLGNTGIFVYDSKEGVLKAPFDKSGNIQTFTALSGLTTSDIKTKNISDMIVMTTSDNVYLLSDTDKTLYKSVFSYDNKYGLMYKYLSNEAFANGSDVLADLSVYVVTSGDDSNIVRYSYSYVTQQQQENPLTITGVDGGLGKLTKGYTRTSLDYSLYVFDSENKRFLKFEKPQESSSNSLHPNELVLTKQYVYRGSKADVWNSVKDFVVDSTETNMYILDGSTIWKVVL